ncbi:exopolysaccharide biosynthesis polyprenyl glycosylphosphotransferase [Fictibacillus solisalsi]|uniref:Exopolysaccharide biosynthesis polyprenyl glycosylphosphotransferase n=1 Tax=Fictibacillus solisalsi TaxID=459525 RepID=A0A1G9YFA7_9BACL|nr:sugar transferase [Fictibacillus solisalsi]SDN07710.1 exopolysaccharide biosynthesis polyprenyl glycosylphosphotransferase [Fictibacillus solisalsi]
MGKNDNGRLGKWALTLGDFVLMHASFLFTLKLQGSRFDESFLIYFVSLAGILTFYLFDLYSDYRRKRIKHLLYPLMISLFIFHVFLQVIGSFEKSVLFLQNHELLLVAFVVQCIVITAFRLSVWYMALLITGKKNVLIIAKDENESIHLANKFLNHTKGWFNLAGYLSVDHIENLEKHLRHIDSVVIGTGLEKSTTDDIMSLCTEKGKEILIVPEMYELFLSVAQTQQIDDMLVFSIQPPKMSKSSQLAKRIFDIAVALTILILTSPVFLLFFILIPVTSKGPAFYKQERVGFKGQRYNIYKFRSMKQDAEKLTGPTLATDHDPRITKVGHLLRATRIDELPQIINVLKGEMSIVGPRPEREFFIHQFTRQVPNYLYRLTVKPGITGLAQVLGSYTTTVEDKLRYDLMYVRNYSLTMDIKILLQTIRVVLQREQAQGVKTEQPKHQLRMLGTK